MNYNRPTSRTRLVRVRGGCIRSLLDRHKKATEKLMGTRYSPAWLEGHVAHGRMELWDIRIGDDSVGYMSAYVSHASLVPAYFVWSLFVDPRLRGWHKGLWKLVNNRGRDLGCKTVEFISIRGADKTQRVPERHFGEDFIPSYTGFVKEIPDG